MYQALPVPMKPSGVTVLPDFPTGLQTQWAEVQRKPLHTGGEAMCSPLSDFWNTVVAAENSHKGLSMCTIIRKQERERASTNEREGK